MDMFKRLFGSTRQADLPTPSQMGDLASLEASASPEAMAVKRRELVRVMVRDTQRRAGIPTGWLDAQLFLEMTRTQAFVHLRLVVKHWDEHLVRVQPLFQRQVIEAVERFEPQAREWLVSISWFYPDALDCPVKQMPDPVVWASSEHVDLDLDPERDEVQNDLARLFAARDAALGGPAGDGGARPAQGG